MQRTLLRCLLVAFCEGNTPPHTVNVIVILKKIHYPRIIIDLKSPDNYPDVDESFSPHESIGKAVFCPKN